MPHGDPTFAPVHLGQQRVRVRVMIGFLVRGRVRIKIRFRVRVMVRVRVRVGVTFNVSIYHRSNCRRSKYRTFKFREKNSIFLNPAVFLRYFHQKTVQNTAKKVTLGISAFVIIL